MSNLRVFRVFVAVLVIGISQVASAQPPRGGFMERMRQQRQSTGGEDNTDMLVSAAGLSFAKIDSDRNREITLQEFQQLGEMIPRLKTANVSGFIFCSLDIDNDGT